MVQQEAHTTNIRMLTDLSPRQWQSRAAVSFTLRHQNGIAPGEGSHLRRQTPPFTAEASAQPLH